MITRLSVLLCVPFALLAGCTSYYRNVDMCKDRMRADYPDAASAPLKITGSGASYHGSRVIVRGEIASNPTPPATRKVQTPAAVECTFSDTTMSSFQWLAPATLAPKTPSDTDADSE
jgi:hypothetical protein